MIDDSKIMRIRRMRLEGQTLSQIRVATGLAIGTIRSYLDDPTRGLVPKAPQVRHSCLESISADELKKMYQACKGRYAALTEAVIEYQQNNGFDDFHVSTSAVRRFILSRFPDLKISKPEPVIFHCEPGQQLQVDFFETKFRFSGQPQPVTIRVFEAVYAFSRRPFVLICPDLTQKSWMMGIIRCLARWGIPRQILCDNDIGLVRRGKYIGDARFNPRFLWICDSIGVQPRACRPLRPQTKGRIERLGGTLKNGIFGTLQALVDTNSKVEIYNTQQLQQRLDAALDKYAVQPRFKLPGKEQLLSVNELYEMERPLLIFPEKLDQWLKIATYTVNISSHATVHLHGIRVHVPYRFANSAAEVMFQADGSFFITTQNGHPIYQGRIPAENLSTFRWDARAPDDGAREITSVADDVFETSPYLNELSELLGE